MPPIRHQDRDVLIHGNSPASDHQVLERQTRSLPGGRGRKLELHRWLAQDCPGGRQCQRLVQIACVLLHERHAPVNTVPIDNRIVVKSGSYSILLK